MRKASLLAASVLVLILAFAAGSEGSVADPHIVDLNLREGEKHVLLSATLVAQFDEEMRQAIRGGVPLKIGYKVRLTRKGSIFGERILGWLTTIEDWPLYSFKKLNRNTRYRVRVMATLRSVELPSVLGYLFFFTTIFNRETPWVWMDFTY